MFFFFFLPQFQLWTDFKNWVLGVKESKNWFFFSIHKLKEKKNMDNLFLEQKGLFLTGIWELPKREMHQWQINKWKKKKRVVDKQKQIDWRDPRNSLKKKNKLWNWPTLMAECKQRFHTLKMYFHRKTKFTRKKKNYTVF